MKLPVTQENVESLGNTKEIDFGVADINLLLHYLRSGIYSNAKQIVVQEIASNAVDANREVGKFDVPVRIKLPNLISPTLEISDSGPGISPDRMINVFTKYGASTKRTDNVQRGGLGIGAKTPFAITDSFIIKTTAIEGDVKVYREYVAALSENRGCKLIEMENATRITDDDTGTTICIEIDERDFNLIKDYCRDITEYWTIKPIFTPDTIKYVKHEQPLINNDGYLIYQNSQSYTCLVDEIPYDIDYSLVDKKHKPFIDKCGNKIILKFGTGEVTIATSRESLQYDNETVATINSRIELIITELKDELSKQLDACKDLWDATVFVIDMKNTYGVSFDKWKNTPITKSSIPIYDINTHLYPIKVQRMILRYNGKHTLRSKIDERHIQVSDYSAIVVGDVKSDIRERAAKFIEQYKLNDIYIVKPHKDQQQLYDDWYNKNNIELYIKGKLSDIPIVKPQKIKRVTSDIELFLYRPENLYSYNRKLEAHRLTKQDIDDLTDFLYVEFDKHNSYSTEIFREKRQLYIVKKNNLKHMTGKKHVDDFIKEKVKSISVKDLNLTIIKENITQLSFLKHVKINNNKCLLKLYQKIKESPHKEEKSIYSHFVDSSPARSFVTKFNNILYVSYPIVSCISYSDTYSDHKDKKDLFQLEQAINILVDKDTTDYSDLYTEFEELIK